ncbi:hypothetical protein GAY33_17380 [Azospirillum brasilense]|uniref:hypothetical protein n=1 Tax=Azospirillum argentinense TaxID=2970906 RepID=UPI00190EA18C|nr:hypothetical protein [Azospirillum argentinense]MBK3800977.1 hypothetical protein [Azospirillum argentinense]
MANELTEDPVTAHAPRWREVTLAEAEKLSKVKSRTLQFWTMNNVIECTPDTRHGGTGVKRLYDIREIAIASIIGKVASLSISIGELSDIASCLRRIYKAKSLNTYSACLRLFNKMDNDPDKLKRLRDQNDGFLAEYSEVMEAKSFYAALEGREKMYFAISKVSGGNYEVEIDGEENLASVRFMPNGVEFSVMFLINPDLVFRDIRRAITS